MQEQCMLGNHASKQVCYWWAFQIIQCLNGNKSTHFIKCKSCCASVLHFPIHKQSHDSMTQKSCAPVTKALQPSFEGPPMAPANMETLVAESTQGTPSRFTLQNERFARPYDAHHQLKYLKDPAHFSETFLGEIVYSKPSHRSYDCTTSHSCLLGFLCQNLFQGTILCSLKQCLFGISIQRVTVTTKQSSLSNCSVELCINSMPAFLTKRPK